LRYELGVCIPTGHIVWRNGPYPWGAFPDIKIVREKIVHLLLPGERYVADRGYGDGGRYAYTPTGFNTPGERMRSLVQAQHEGNNGCPKKFKILSTRKQNKIESHYKVFYSLCNAIQLYIEDGNISYNVYYNEIEVPD
jgi:hypothetical protein